jgi:tetratricopeptide (TPR) repeat protein
MRLVEIAPAQAETQHHLGLIGLSTKRYGDAEYHLKQCLELEPPHPVCHYELGNVYLATERLDEAILEYIAALRSPSEIMIAASQNLREAYRRSGHRDGANMVLIDRCRGEPGNADCRFDLGVLFAERGLFEEATREWRAAAELQPGYCSAHYRLAMEADRVLDTPEMERSCRETIACANQTQDHRFRAMKEECVALLRRISE